MKFNITKAIMAAGVTMTTAIAAMLATNNPTFAGYVMVISAMIVAGLEEEEKMVN